MIAPGDAGWHDLGASAVLHLIGAALILTLATSGGPGTPDGAARSTSGGSAGAGSPPVLGVALLGQQGSRGTAGAPRASQGPQAAEVTRVAISRERMPEAPRSVAAPAHEPGAARAPDTREVAPEITSGAPGEASPEVTSAAPGDSGGIPAGQGGDGTQVGDGAGTRAVEAGGSGAGPGGVAAAGGGPSDVTAPAPLHFAVPALPRGVRPSDTRGARARLLLYVTDSGEVREVKLLSGTSMTRLDEAAVEAGYRMRYRPGTRNGAPAAMWTEAEVLF